MLGPILHRGLSPIQPIEKMCPENDWKKKRVLITGVCGTVGRELLRQLVLEGPAEIIGVDNNESELFFLGQELQEFNPGLRLYLSDVRDGQSMMRVMEGVDVVLHTAALKHVHLCEESPRDAVQTNIMGVQNIIDAAVAQGVERVLFTSSDKAVNPTSVMGTSKLMGERLFTAADCQRRSSRPIFASTRFGNVLGSRGSVIPLFQRQICGGGPVTLTDRQMTRFIMTLEGAVALVMDSVFMARGGEVFVTKMPVVRIEDLAEVMIEELAERYGHSKRSVEIRVIGSKPGEKIYEELLNEEEVRRASELSRYFVVQPAVAPVFQEERNGYDEPVLGPVSRAYNSAVEEAMTKEELRAYLLRYSLVDPLPNEGTARATGSSPLQDGRE